MAPRFKKTAADRQRHFIREWRKHRGLTQDQLAERVGISKPNLSRLENRKQDYTQSLLEALAEALQCEPADLIMRDPSAPEMPWSIWESLKPAQQRQAVELLKALKRADEEAA